MTVTGAEQPVVTALAEALVRLSHVVQHVFADVSREHDLTPQQTQLLCTLAAGPVGMTELSRLLHLERSSLSGLVDRVERRRLLERVPDPHDRRALRVALTEHGLTTAHAAHADVIARLAAPLTGLGIADAESLREIVGRVLTGHDVPIPGT